MPPARRGAQEWCFAAGVLFGMLLLPSTVRAQAVLETPQQTNDRIRALSSAAHVLPHDYVIGNGDVIDIEVFDVKELSREVRVSQTGFIGIPLVPVRLHVAGLTEVQTEQKIAEVLEANGLVSHPQVSISVKERKSKPITVVGAVQHAMVYQADRPVTILEVLAEAGGIANDAGDTVIVTRPSQEPSVDSSEPLSAGPEDSSSATTPKESAESGTAPTESLSNSRSVSKSSVPKMVVPLDAPTKSADAVANPPALNEAPPLSNTITINLNELVESGNATNNIILQAGDIVTVPHAGITYILGAVNKPGGYVMANDRSQMSTLRLLALSGGLTRTAKKDRAVIIRKDSQGQQQEVAVDLKKVLDRTTEDVALRASDILYVPDSASKQALYRSLEFGLALGAGVALYRLAYH
jgi:polysaccharide biosynthesis/export protein